MQTRTNLVRRQVPACAVGTFTRTGDKRSDSLGLSFAQNLCHSHGMSATQSLNGYAAGEIRATLARRRMTARDLAERMGVKRMWVQYRLAETTPLQLDDLDRIAAALDVPVTDLIPGGTRGELNRRSPLMPNQPMPVPGYATPTLTNPPPMTRLNGYTERRSPERATRRPVRLTTPTADSAP